VQPETVARVVLVPSPRRLGPLDYRVPEGLRMEAGMRVLVPLGGRRSMGVVIELRAGPMPEERLRDVIALLDDAPVLDSALMRLVDWMADYYLAPAADVIAAALPPALRVETERAVEATGVDREIGGTERELIAFLAENRNTAIASLERRFGSGTRRAIRRLETLGLVRIVERLRREATPTRRVRFYRALASTSLETSLASRPALAELHRYLRDHPAGEAPLAEIRPSFPNAATKLRRLAAAGRVAFRDEGRYRAVLPAAPAPDREVTLSAAQRVAASAIEAAIGTGFEPFLLHGVTGSGKTEVYLRGVAAARAAGRTALLLVPEISLTHQLVARVRARFGAGVAVLHSQLGDGERWDEWRRIARGEVDVVIGARSAVFAPLGRLGLIIVDEEHDGSYKQADGVRYHGRDVAVMRAKLTGAVLVLGSATPSMESFANARSGRYRLLKLPERVEARPLPAVRLVDLRGEAAASGPLSPLLSAAVEANLAAGGQTLLFLNRRGFANFLQCRACGEPLMCPNCSVTLTVHRASRALRCHYCDHTIAPPSVCPGCGEPALRDWGIGTEQLESLLARSFPGARIGRLDRDTTRRRGSLERLLERWTGGGLDILIGTQMITKGHDVPGVTLVGVVLADLSLNVPDFRAAERTFQLLAQVAGRAGRGERAGQVIVQTLQPAHMSLQAAVAHDFATFAEKELAARRGLGYPPFGRLVLLRAEGGDAGAVRDTAHLLASRLRALSGGRFAVLGPAPAPLERLRQRHRQQILIRSRSGNALRQAARAVLGEVAADAAARQVRLIADVDPVHML
jgi:primosomal protein N' (replication factor Y)